MCRFLNTFSFVILGCCGGVWNSGFRVGGLLPAGRSPGVGEGVFVTFWMRSDFVEVWIVYMNFRFGGFRWAGQNFGRLLEGLFELIRLLWPVGLWVGLPFL